MASLMSRIQKTFERLHQENKKGLIPFIAAGYPQKGWTVALMHTLVSAGADIIEIGIPFSDPMADGQAIQKAYEHALKNGTNLTRILEEISEFRKSNNTTPVVLMGYANPIERMGTEAFVQSAQQAGVDGVLVVDYPPEECLEFTAQLRAKNLDQIFLLSPTSSNKRIEHVAQSGSGYIYYVSLKGVTGAAHIDVDEVKEKIHHITQHSHLPIAIGFGIRDAQTAAAVSKLADAIVIGSRLMQILDEQQHDLLKAQQCLATFIHDIQIELKKC